jgi:hypothetical protein
MDNEFIGLRLTGMKPADVRAGELATIISSFEDMIASTVNRSRPQVSKEDLGIGLVHIEDKSVGLEFATKLPELALPAYYTITESVSSEKFLQLSSETLKHLRVIHAFIKTHDCEGEMFSRNGQVAIKAVLLPKIEIPEHPQITSQTLMYGRIVRVGGTEPRVMFDSASGQTLFCRVKDESLARKIGERLYTWAGFEGTVILDSDSLEVLEFRVENMTDYEGGLSFRDAFAALSALTREYYSDVGNADEYVEGLRT